MCLCVDGAGGGCVCRLMGRVWMCLCIDEALCGCVCALMGQSVDVYVSVGQTECVFVR